MQQLEILIEAVYGIGAKILRIEAAEMHSLTRWSVMARHARKSICIRNLCGGKV
jgi:hypothetical protein